MYKISLVFLMIFLASCAVHPTTKQGDHHYERGLELIRQDRYEEAIQPLKLALSKDEKSPSILYALGYTSMELGKKEIALDYYSRCSQCAPAESYLVVESLVGKAVVLHSMQRYQRAIENYDQALRLSPLNAKIYFNRGCAYGELNDYSKATTDFQRVLSLDSDYDGARYNLLYYEHAKCLAERGEAFVQ